MGLCHAFGLPFEAELHPCRWEAILVIACAIFQIARYFVSPAREFQRLGELGGVLEVTYLHLEQLVECGDFLARRAQLVHKLGAR